MRLHRLRRALLVPFLIGVYVVAGGHSCHHHGHGHHHHHKLDVTNADDSSDGVHAIQVDGKSHPVDLAPGESHRIDGLDPGTHDVVVVWSDGQMEELADVEAGGEIEVSK